MVSFFATGLIRLRKESGVMAGAAAALFFCQWRSYYDTLTIRMPVSTGRMAFPFLAVTVQLRPRDLAR
jgi:hypothetical protein